MPQVYMILGSAVGDEFTNPVYSVFFTDALKGIVKSTEGIFQVPVKDDVAVTVVKSVLTINEADIQIEIRYTAGKDEYHKGKPFDPTEQQQKKLAKKILKITKKYFGSRYVASVWIKPYYKSVFVFKE
jgi:hypothetical protein